VRDNTAVTVAEQGAGNPDVLLKWFYLGEQTGHGFVYSKLLEKEITQDRQQTVVANRQPNSGYEAGGSH
jgi:hypothetical protein